MAWAGLSESSDSLPELEELDEESLLEDELLSFFFFFDLDFFSCFLITFFLSSIRALKSFVASCFSTFFTLILPSPGDLDLLLFQLSLFFFQLLSLATTFFLSSLPFPFFLLNLPLFSFFPLTFLYFFLLSPFFFFISSDFILPSFFFHHFTTSPPFFFFFSYPFISFPFLLISLLLSFIPLLSFQSFLLSVQSPAATSVISSSLFLPASIILVSAGIKFIFTGSVLSLFPPQALTLDFQSLQTVLSIWFFSFLHLFIQPLFLLNIKLFTLVILLFLYFVLHSFPDRHTSLHTPPILNFWQVFLKSLL